MKDVGLRIRIQRELREKFIEACRTNDKAAAQVLREFMRSYVDRNSRFASEERRVKLHKKRGDTHS